MKSVRVIAVIVLSVSVLGCCIWLSATDVPVLDLSAANAAGDDEDLLTALSEGCANAASAIRSGRGHVRTYFWRKKGDDDVLETETESYLTFKGEQFLLREETKYLTVPVTPNRDPSEPPPPTVVNVTASYDLERVTIVTQSDSLPTHATITDSTRVSGIGQLNVYKTFIAVLGHGVDYLVPRPEDLPPVAEVTSAKIVGRETIEGDECIVVDVAVTVSVPGGDNAVSTVRKWVDLDKGYTIVRTRIWQEREVDAARTLISESSTTVRQYGDDVWGPDTFTWQQYDLEGDVTHRGTTAYGPDFQLNVPVSDNELALALPSGTKVYNELIDVQYTVP